MRIGIITSSDYTNASKILEIFRYLKKNIGNQNAIIYGAGNDYLDQEVKKQAIKFEFKFGEYNPSYTGKKLYSMEDEEYYGKKYHISHLYDRYYKLFRTVDTLIVLMKEDSSDSILIKSLERYSKKKKIKILN